MFQCCLLIAFEVQMRFANFINPGELRFLLKTFLSLVLLLDFVKILESKMCCKL